MLSTHLNDQATNERYETVVSGSSLSIYVYIIHIHIHNDTAIVQATDWQAAKREQAHE